jgi:serine protease Do
MTNSSLLWKAAGVSTLASLVVSSLTVYALRGTQSAYGNTAVLPQAITASGGLTALDAETANSPIVRTVKSADPAVVSVIISKDVPVVERRGRLLPDPFADPFFFQTPQASQSPSTGAPATQKQEIGGGTAFFVSADGLLLTNKHVVEDPGAQYTVFLNDGRKLTANVVGRDPVNDIALLKVAGSGFPFIPLTTAAAEPVLGETVVAIGNALGEFRNTVSVGVVSGLERSITAGGLLSGQSEELSNIIQTDAAINEGNSGGPLLDLQGNVVGMNTAVAGDAQNIAFAIPVRDLAVTLQSYQKYGRIVRPYAGIRYAPMTKEYQDKNHLPYDYGVIAIGGGTVDEPAVVPGSPADKAGLQEGDIVLEADGKKLTEDVSFSALVQRKQPGDTMQLKVYHKGQEKTVTITLEERKT